MPSFFRQWLWEVRKLLARPRTWLGVGAVLFWQIVEICILRLPAVRASIAAGFRKFGFTFAESFTGLTAASYLLANTMTFVGTLFIALIAADLMAQEREEGTLRMLLARPVGRARLFSLKLLTAIAFTLLFTWFIGLSGFVIGLIAEGPGRLVMVGYKESVLGVFEWSEGLRRYGLAVLLVSLGVCTIALTAFTFSCARMKPASATAIALSIFIADDAVRNIPSMLPLRHHFLMTRIIAWVGAFNDPLHVERLQRAYTELAVLNLALVAVAWLLFRRAEFKP